MTNEAIQRRVEELLGQMTLEEKAAQMVQVPYAMVGREEALRWAKRWWWGWSGAWYRHCWCKL